MSKRMTMNNLIFRIDSKAKEASRVSSEVLLDSAKNHSIMNTITVRLIKWTNLLKNYIFPSKMQSKS